MDNAELALVEGVDDGDRENAGGCSAVSALSNDYLNHFSEALMLIELAAGDPGATEDLLSWRPVSYPDYFAASQLRRAPAARAAYFALGEAERAVFEEVIAAMDRLALTAIGALRQPLAGPGAGEVAAVTVPALRRLIGLAGRFLNSGGTTLPTQDEAFEEAQVAIDRLLERPGPES